MTAFAGREVLLRFGGASPADEIPGIREKSIEIGGEAIDISSDDSDSWRELLTVAGQNEVTISLSGVTKSTRLKTHWFAGTRTQVVTLEYPSGHGTISGTFYLSKYSETGTYNEATTFEAELMSTGVVTFTP